MLINNILLSVLIIFLWSMWSVITYKVLKYIKSCEYGEYHYQSDIEDDVEEMDNICLSFFPGTLIIMSVYYFVKLNIRISNIIIDNIINMLLKGKNL